MTVASSTDRATFPGNGVTQIFPLPFRFFANSEIQAWLVTNATGALTALTLGTHYTLSGAGEPEVDGNPTSELTMLTAPTALQSLFVQRVIPVTQPTDIVNQGPFFPEIHENVFDRMTMLIQQASGESKGAIRVAIGDPEPTRLPNAISRALLLMGFDVSGNPIAVAPTSGSAADLALSLANSSDPAKGAGQVGWSRNQLDAVTTTVRQALDSLSVNIWEYANLAVGYSSGGDQTTWRWGPALQAAINACPVGGTVHIPAKAVVYTFDTTGGLSASPVVDKAITLLIDGHIKSNSFTIGANPTYIFRVTASNVTICGNGTVEGNGAADVTSAGGAEETFPGLVHVLGAAGFKWSGVRILKSPKIGLYLRSCTNADVSHAVIEGGAVTFEPATLPGGGANPSYVGSYLCPIVTTGGSGNKFSKLSFIAGGDGGRCVQAIFNGGITGPTHGCVVEGCYADRPWEKLTYFNGSKHRIYGNLVDGPTFTDVFRLWGGSNELFGNTTNGCNSGAQALDGASNSIHGNSFLGCTQSGINVQDLTVGYVGGLGLTSVIGNTVTSDGVTATKGGGITIQGKASTDVIGCVIARNIISGFGYNGANAASITTVSPSNVQASSIEDNFFISCGEGSHLSRSSGGAITGNRYYACSGIANKITDGENNEVSRNLGKNPGTWMLSLAGTPAGTRFLDNRSIGATNIGIQNIGAVFLNDNYGRGNQYTTKPLVGAATLGAATPSSIITHGGVAPNATVSFLATSSVFGLKHATSGFYAGLATNDFAVATADGSNPGAGCDFRYEIIQ